MRSITMKHFRDRDSQTRASFLSPEPGKNNGQAGEPQALGQIIGDVWEAKLTEGELPNGDKATSIVLLGEFIAVNYLEKQARDAAVEAGETDSKGKLLTPYTPMESNKVFLPGYFAELVQSQLKLSTNGVGFAVEIWVVPNTGRGTAYMYEVKKLLAQAHSSRLAQMIEAAHAEGVLRIPVALSKPAPQLTLEARASEEIDAETGEVTEAASLVPEPEPEPSKSSKRK